MLKNSIAAEFITPNLKKLQINDEPIRETLFIAYDQGATSIENKVTTKFAHELGTTKLKQMFIKKALASGQFFSVQIKLFRVGEVVLKYLSPELSYIGSYAIHRAKQIEQEMYSVAGIIQFEDVTSEVMLRYQLSS